MNSADGLNVPPEVSSVVPVEGNCTKKGLWLTGAFLSDVERSRPSAPPKVAHRRAALLFNYMYIDTNMENGKLVLSET